MAGQGVSVHGMFRFEIPKASPEAVAQGTFDGMGNKEEDIAKAFERENANFVPGSAAV
jgi:hypothetical protein